MKINGTQLAIGLGLLAITGYNFYYLFNLNARLTASQGALASSAVKAQNLERELSALKAENADLHDSLQSEKERNDDLAGQIGDITDTVGVLQKIKNTDPQLLEKYSKVYFLNENYVPSRLTNISKEYLFDKSKPLLFHANVLPHLEDMLAAAAKAGVDLLVGSAFRSFANQASIKSSYAVTYGSGANQFSADQGYSEHQLGTAVDLILPTETGLTINFEQTEAYKWLADNAYRYGFILSYPKGNAYYQFEPWHWRFVGLSLAKYLHREKKNFYDLDQRQIDEYRADFFN